MRIDHKKIPIKASFTEEVWSDVIRSICASSFYNENTDKVQETLKKYIDCKWRVIHERPCYDHFSEEAFSDHLEVRREFYDLYEKYKTLKKQLDGKTD